MTQQMVFEEGDPPPFLDKHAQANDRNMTDVEMAEVKNCRGR